MYLRDLISIDNQNFIDCCKPRLLLTSYNFRHKSIQNWNYLPDRLRNETSLLVFKKGVKELIRLRRTDPGLDPNPDALDGVDGWDGLDNIAPDVPDLHARPPDLMD